VRAAAIPLLTTLESLLAGYQRERGITHQRIPLLSEKVKITGRKSTVRVLRIKIQKFHEQIAIT
jgi:hypothetical protein